MSKKLKLKAFGAKNFTNNEIKPWVYFYLFWSFQQTTEIKWPWKIDHDLIWTWVVLYVKRPLCHLCHKRKTIIFSSCRALVFFSDVDVLKAFLLFMAFQAILLRFKLLWVTLSLGWKCSFGFTKVSFRRVGKTFFRSIFYFFIFYWNAFLQEWRFLDLEEQ